MQHGLDRLHLDAGAGEFEAARTYPGHQPPNDRPQPVRHASERKPARGEFDVLQKTLDRPSAFTSAAGLGGSNLLSEQAEQFFAALVAHQQPLFALAAM